MGSVFIFISCLLLLAELSFSGATVKAEVNPLPVVEVEKWVRQLYSPDVAIRTSAAISLLSTRQPAAIEPLINILKGVPSPNGTYSGAKAQDKEVLITVMKAFGFLGNDSAVAPLMELLQKEEQEVREVACQSLGRLRTPLAIEKMANQLKEEKYPLPAKVLLIRALGQTRDREAVEPLLVLLGAKEKELREAAIESLSLMTTQSFGKESEKWHEWWKLNKVKSREQWLADIIDRLEEVTKELRVENESLRREVAQKTIALLSDAANRKELKPLLEAMKQGHTEVRLYAIKEVSKFNDPNILPQLVILLADKEKEVRAAAVQAIGAMGDEKVIEYLLPALKDEDSLVREKAAKTLGKFHKDIIVDSLIAVLKSDDTLVIIAACESMGQIGNSKAVDPLTGLLTSSDSKVREASVMALGRLKDQRAVAPLLTALKDKEERVRWYAADSLGNLKNVQAVDPLVSLLTDKSARVREAAAEALGKIGSEKALQPLLNSLSDGDKKVVERASEALLGLKLESFEALSQVADALFNNKDYGRASQVMSRQISQFPTSEKLPETRHKLAKTYCLQKDWQKALILYEDQSKYDKADVEAKTGLLLCLREMKQYDRILELYALWMQESPEHSKEWWKGRLEVLNTLFEQGNYSRVSKVIDTFLTEDPELGGPELKSKYLELAAKSSSKITQASESKPEGLPIP